MTLPNASFLSGQSHLDTWDFLRSEDQVFVSALVPTIVCLIVLMLGGLVGNSTVFVVYYKKFKPSTTRTYILALSVCDLFINSLVFSGDVAIIRFKYTFTSASACKLIGFVTHFLILYSGFILIAVAWDRRRKVCQVSHRHNSTTGAHFSLVLCAIIALLHSAAYTVLSGPHTIKTQVPNVTGLTCAVDDPYVNSDFLVIYKVCGFVTAIVGFSMIIVSYVQIARYVWLHKREMRKKIISSQCRLPKEPPDDSAHADNVPVAVTQASTSESTSSSGFYSSQKCRDDSGCDVDHRVVDSLGEDTDENSRLNVNDGLSRNYRSDHSGAIADQADVEEAESQKTRAKSLSLGNAHDKISDTENSEGKNLGGQEEETQRNVLSLNRRRARAASARKEISTRTTMMLFVLTVIFAVNYIPYVVIILFFNGHDPEGINIWVLNLYHIALRSTRLNSTINPLVYNFFSIRFRKECRRLFRLPPP